MVGAHFNKAAVSLGGTTEGGSEETGELGELGGGNSLVLDIGNLVQAQVDPHARGVFNDDVDLLDIGQLLTDQGVDGEGVTLGQEGHDGLEVQSVTRKAGNDFEGQLLVDIPVGIPGNSQEDGCLGGFHFAGHVQLDVAIQTDEVQVHVEQTSLTGNAGDDPAIDAVDEEGGQVNGDGVFVLLDGGVARETLFSVPLQQVAHVDGLGPDDMDDVLHLHRGQKTFEAQFRVDGPPQFLFSPDERKLTGQLVLTTGGQFQDGRDSVGVGGDYLGNIAEDDGAPGSDDLFIRLKNKQLINVFI